MEIHFNQMNISAIRFLSLIAGLLVFGFSYAEEQKTTITWKKINDKENVSVYSTEVHGSDILKIKAQTIIDASISHVQAILNNVEHRSSWIPYLQKCIIIEKLSDTENVEYSLFSAPWPASDRDFVYKITQVLNSESTAIYHMTSTQHAHKPEHNNRIRADLMESTYTLTALSTNKTQVELIYHADPKGWLPNWIINIIQRILPYLILRNLHDEATKAGHMH